MKTNGLLTIGVAQSSTGTDHEIISDFKPDYRVLDLVRQYRCELFQLGQ